jgi:hypothetical protein
MQGARRWSYQNTVLIAEVIARVAIAFLITVFLVVPLYILSHHGSKNVQLVVVSVWILVLSVLVALLLKVTSFELMAISAAYAAVLSVFVSNVPATSSWASFVLDQGKKVRVSDPLDMTTLNVEAPLIFRGRLAHIICLVRSNRANINFKCAKGLSRYRILVLRRDGVDLPCAGCSRGRPLEGSRGNQRG